MPKKAKSSKSVVKDLEWKRKNRWNDLPAIEGKLQEQYCKDYLRFLSLCKTEREAHDEAVRMAEGKGYVNIEVLRKRGRTLKAGDKVYRSYGGKTVMLAIVGKKSMEDGMHLVGGHTDAPRLDAKPNPLYEDNGIVLLDTHYYGGVKKYQWVTMPLAIHGVVVKESGEKVNIVIGEADEDPVFVITDLLPHLGKEQAEKKLREGVHGEALNLLMGSIPEKSDGDDKDNKSKSQSVKKNLLRLLNEKYGITEEDFAGAELEIVPAGAARELGFDRSMLLGYAHDDRICAYAGLKALLDIRKTPEYTAAVLLCDREEIGSVGATGMDSTFFENTVAEMIALTEDGYDGLVVRRCMEKSKMLSADVTVLHDPNYPEVSSPNNTAKMNCGVAISKYTGARGKSGCSEASAEFMAEVRALFNKNGVYWQTCELGKVDQGGGGTIAMFMARYGMDVVDCGVGLLSMHAPWEAAGKLDTYMAYKGYKVFMENKR